MDKITTSLHKIKAHLPCTAGYAKLLRSLPPIYKESAPITFSHILSSNSIMDTLWCIHTISLKHKTIHRLFLLDLIKLFMKKVEIENDYMHKYLLESLLLFIKGDLPYKEALRIKNFYKSYLDTRPSEEDCLRYVLLLTSSVINKHYISGAYQLVRDLICESNLTEEEIEAFSKKVLSLWLLYCKEGRELTEREKKEALQNASCVA